MPSAALAPAARPGDADGVCDATATVGRHSLHPLSLLCHLDAGHDGLHWDLIDRIWWTADSDA